MNRCTEKELEEFMHEWEAILTGIRSPIGVLAKIAFERDKMAHCLDCGRMIPAGKDYCPFCRPSRF